MQDTSQSFPLLYQTSDLRMAWKLMWIQRRKQRSIKHLFISDCINKFSCKNTCNQRTNHENTRGKASLTRRSLKTINGKYRYSCHQKIKRKVQEKICHRYNQKIFCP